MKRIITVLFLFAIVLAGCGKGDKYDKDIDKVYKKQEETNKMLPAFGLKVDKKVDRNDSNTYVYKDGKVFVIGVQLSKKVE
ncbi:cystatin-like fold lipoprotein, partial [Staphylococcus warneri]|uniref:cystatin-like fold lipoprotein n=1 Tax=Staphylococcus warneri TaxID=1292 RepID=UPI00103DA32C